jgi:hypothetical protein
MYRTKKKAANASSRSRLPHPYSFISGDWRPIDPGKLDHAPPMPKSDLKPLLAVHQAALLFLLLPQNRQLAQPDEL